MGFDPSRPKNQLHRLDFVGVHGVPHPPIDPLVDHRSEADVFGAEAPPPPEVPIPGTPAGERREGPRPLPRPGLAGGTAE